MTDIDEWPTPLVDYYTMKMPEGAFPTRQANGLAVTIINCREEPERKILSLMLYSTALGTGMLMPLSPETVQELAQTLLSASLDPQKDSMQ